LSWFKRFSSRYGLLATLSAGNAFENQLVEKIFEHIESFEFKRNRTGIENRAATKKAARRVMLVPPPCFG
jgi:hypothetical protein